jgi:hypothetical protein
MYAASAGSVLYNSSYQITAAGEAYQALLKSWTTDDMTTVGANGVVTLPGSAFYGEYEAIINGQDYDFEFNSSTGSYVLVAVPEPSTFGAAAMGLLCVANRRFRRHKRT